MFWPLIKFYDMFIIRVFVVQYFMTIWNSFFFIIKVRTYIYDTVDIVVRQKLGMKALSWIVQIKTLNSQTIVFIQKFPAIMGNITISVSKTKISWRCW